VAITEHPDLGLRTSIILDLNGGASMSIASTIAPQIHLDDIKPTSGNFLHIKNISKVKKVKKFACMYNGWFRLIYN
jgi:hypothetical protein